MGSVARFRLDFRHPLILCNAILKNRQKRISLKLALDTGATYTMVAYEALAAIGVEPAKFHRKVDVTTGSGIVLAPLARVPIFQSLGHELKNLEVICHDLPTEGIVDGLLGLNFLRKFNVYLGFLDNRMEVNGR